MLGGFARPVLQCDSQDEPLRILTRMAKECVLMSRTSLSQGSLGQLGFDC